MLLDHYSLKTARLIWILKIAENLLKGFILSRYDASVLNLYSYRKLLNNTTSTIANCKYNLFPEHDDQSFSYWGLWRVEGNFQMNHRFQLCSTGNKQIIMSILYMRKTRKVRKRNCLKTQSAFSPVKLPLQSIKFTERKLITISSC